MVMVEDNALRERLCRHLVKDHLLTPIAKLEPEPILQRAVRLENTMRLSELVELHDGSPEGVQEIIDQLLAKSE